MFPKVNLRMLVWATLAMALLMNYVTWLHDYPSAPPEAVTAAPANGGPAAAPALGGSVPVLAAPAASPSQPVAALATPATAAVAPIAPRVHVVTDVLDVEVSLAGGELTRADLLAYAQVKGAQERVRLLNRDSDQSLFVLQSGFLGAAGTSMPTHLALFNTQARELRLGAGQDELRVPLTWSDGAGVTVTKTYVFHRGRYAIELEYQVRNASAAPWQFAPYAQILRNNDPVATSYFHPESYAYKGPAYDDGKKYQKLKPGKDATTLDAQVSGGWIAALQHHFAAAIVPPAGEAWHYLLTTRGVEYQFTATGPSQQLAAGATSQLRQTLFVGPKLQHQLEQASPRLYLVTDYNWLSVVAQPLFWLLDKVHNVVGNWGWTIMVTTLLLKLLFYPLSEASMRSMARMKALQPRIKLLQETYKDQRDKLGKAMMELYQREKVNPVAGCLPMLIQFPVFIAFYWVLLESVEMRQAPFMGWIGDLSARDPIFVLPALMAVGNYINFKLNPQMGDPTQQKMFMIMQLGMPVMFAFMPSGLVLYWTTNTVLSILQQWNINRRIAAQTKARD
ncbi:MAG TPA: membrane protein insertase YidC [Steroidobacteraceae bacterium]|nr:membrane protein insertase YidC [Steroidobacteraceae bacterium]